MIRIAQVQADVSFSDDPDGAFFFYCHDRSPFFHNDSFFGWNYNICSGKSKCIVFGSVLNITKIKTFPFFWYFVVVGRFLICYTWYNKYRWREENKHGRIAAGDSKEEINQKIEGEITASNATTLIPLDPFDGMLWLPVMRKSRTQSPGIGVTIQCLCIINAHYKCVTSQKLMVKHQC